MLPVLARCGGTPWRRGREGAWRAGRSGWWLGYRGGAKELEGLGGAEARTWPWSRADGWPEEMALAVRGRSELAAGWRIWSGGAGQRESSSRAMVAWVSRISAIRT